MLSFLFPSFTTIQVPTPVKPESFSYLKSQTILCNKTSLKSIGPVIYNVESISFTHVLF